MRRILIFCAVFALVGAALALGWRGAGVSPASTPHATRPAAPPATPRHSGPRSDPARRSVERHAPVAPTRPPLEYGDAIEHLVVDALRLNRRADANADQDELAAIDTRARGLLDRLLHEIRNSPERALHDLTRATAGPDPAPTALRVRRLVLLRVVQEGLAWRHRHRNEAAVQSGLDSLVAACLDVLPLDPRLAEELGAGTLAERPYLGTAHESAVLRLFDLAADDPALGRVASALLVTLWRNLERDGSRTPGETASLALLFAEDASPSRRAAALEHLLRSTGTRYLTAALEAVQRTGDRQLTDQFACVAAQVLEPSTALEVLRSLAEGQHGPCLAAHLQLAHRAPEEIQRTYETHLADGTAAAFRLGLVRSAGWTRDEAAVELATTAYESDPDPGIQRDAVLALASSAPADRLPAIFESILGDPAKGSQPAWLDTIAGALVNADGSGSLELLSRYGPPLLRDTRLSPDYRDQLAEALEARLPKDRAGRTR